MCKELIYLYSSLYNYIITSVCVFCRWEEEYTARMDLQEKVAELEEVKRHL